VIGLGSAPTSRATPARARRSASGARFLALALLCVAQAITAVTVVFMVAVWLLDEAADRVEVWSEALGRTW
jgi:hypothetical protein